MMICKHTIAMICELDWDCDNCPFYKWLNYEADCCGNPINNTSKQTIRGEKGKGLGSK